MTRLRKGLGLGFPKLASDRRSDALPRNRSREKVPLVEKGEKGARWRLGGPTSEGYHSLAPAPIFSGVVPMDS